ncbi:hypothetical protein [Phaeobacter sp. 22II1-1F12B]|uniref:hypothetical protein n=1 Tax=Phaeobacter sp. 22II1-1F12B TaxID=1317111 RepID=UPI0011849E26|nr:hypothetical protein [Phaeobacter sp. 22II1-1F12B]
MVKTFPLRSRRMAIGDGKRVEGRTAVNHHRALSIQIAFTMPGYSLRQHGYSRRRVGVFSISAFSAAIIDTKSYLQAAAPCCSTMDTRSQMMKISRTSGKSSEGSGIRQAQDFIVYDEERQEIVGVGTSPEDALASVEDDFRKGVLHVLPARPDLVADVRDGYDTCWEIDGQGFAWRG